MTQRIMLMIEHTSQYLSLVKGMYLKEWNVSINMFFVLLREIVLLTEHDSYLARSAWSRADKPVMKISDLSKEESINYLVDKRKVKEEEAKRLYELVGGRIVNLKSVANKFLAGQTFEGK